MQDSRRIRIAALATALFLAALSAAGVAVRPDHASHAPATTASTQAAQRSFSEAGEDDEPQAANAAGFSEADDE